VISHKNGGLNLCTLPKTKKGLAFHQEKRYFNYRKRLSLISFQNEPFIPGMILNRFRLPVPFGPFPGNSQGNLQIIKNTYF
jgi:hypothetical protein